MKNYIATSKKYLEEEIKNICHDLYVSALDRAEKILKPDRNSPEWKHFRFDILNLGNESIRNIGKSLSNYYVEYRPPLFSVEYKGEVPNSTNKLAVFDFGFVNNEPCFKVFTNHSDEAHDILIDIRELLECGQLFETKESYSLVVNGRFDCFHKVIPFFLSKNALKGKALERFMVWKEKVYNLEGQGNDK